MANIIIFVHMSRMQILYSFIFIEVQTGDIENNYSSLSSQNNVLRCLITTQTQGSSMLISDPCYRPHSHIRNL